jgi:hypothetical protein
MTETTTLMALFADIDPASEAVEKLREMGVADQKVDVITGTPVTAEMLGRPEAHTNVPRFAMAGAVLGLLVGIFLTVATPNLYSIYVGGQPLIPVPPSVVVTFEMMMLGMLILTFIGVFLESVYPDLSEKEYVPEISDGKLAVLFACPTDELGKFEGAMKTLGAESVRVAERTQL